MADRNIVILLTASVVGDLGPDYGNEEATNDAITKYMVGAYEEGSANVVPGVVVTDVQVADIILDDYIDIDANGKLTINRPTAAE